jgi:hypothetical protein
MAIFCFINSDRHLIRISEDSLHMNKLELPLLFLMTLYIDLKRNPFGRFDDETSGQM